MLIRSLYVPSLTLLSPLSRSLLTPVACAISPCVSHANTRSRPDVLIKQREILRICNTPHVTNERNAAWAADGRSDLEFGSFGVRFVNTIVNVADLL